MPDRIKNGTAVKIDRAHRIGERVALGIGKRVPRPGVAGLQREAVVMVDAFEALQAGDVHGEGKVAVAEGKRGLGVEPGVANIVPGDDRVAVDGRGRFGSEGDRGQGGAPYRKQKRERPRKADERKR